MLHASLAFFQISVCWRCPATGCHPSFCQLSTRLKARIHGWQRHTSSYSCSTSLPWNQCYDDFTMTKAYTGSHWSSGRQWTLPYRISKLQSSSTQGVANFDNSSDPTLQRRDDVIRTQGGYTRYWTFRLWMPCRHKMWHFLPIRATLMWLINLAAPYLKCIFSTKNSTVAIFILRIHGRQCVILFLCFLVFLVLLLPRLGKRELILVLFVRLFDLCLFGFVGFLFLLGSGKGCGLWLWHSLDFSLIIFLTSKYRIIVVCVDWQYVASIY